MSQTIANIQSDYPYNVIDTRLNCIVYGLNNYDDAEEIKNSLNRIHNIYKRNNREYSLLYNSENPYSILLIRTVYD